ncbi:MAG: hypothetical protein LBL98_02340 [Ruminococcus sp.]|nr:hypothetical protein [Ruminococcus sp.]
MVFEIVRESVSAERAAAYYGIEIKRKRCRCPFHNGNDFNLSFHGGGFNCFVCGTHGDSIEFTRLLFGYQKPIDAVKRLNSDFCLCLDLGKVGKGEWNPTLADIRRKTAERELPKAVHKILWEFALNLDWVKRSLAPKTPEEKPLDVWFYALQNLSFAEYILDCFENLTHEGQLDFAVKEKEMISLYERISKFIDGLRRTCNAA